MSTWGEILKELREIMEKEKKPPFDMVRRRCLENLLDSTGGNTVLYATKWTQPGDIPSKMVSIHRRGHPGFMEEAISNLPKDALDLDYT